MAASGGSAAGSPRGTGAVRELRPVASDLADNPGLLVDGLDWYRPKRLSVLHTPHHGRPTP
ncbi:predicted protein [Streptomyces viridosporus ATCC 14672]|uniref:Predicted protein n=1 Tax=Streptomyces viridosporus (strain ATCC 14672 / DSM 40746 / JCM 4963 / KCTC 9882 / NRRL B-12104 / FH 1290) TaxID=566461 RepID=D5ZZK0_STRV1|nr:predicted protein [Streptomyces viridosporus ATCC 14672]